MVLYFQLFVLESSFISTLQYIVDANAYRESRFLSFPESMKYAPKYQEVLTLDL